MNVVLFTNWTAKRFAYPDDELAMYNGEPFAIEPGESKWLEDYKAQKFARNIAERELYSQDKPLIPVVVAELAEKCFAKSIELGASVTPSEAIAEQVAEEVFGEDAPKKIVIKKGAKKPSKKEEEEFEGINE